MSTVLQLPLFGDAPPPIPERFGRAAVRAIPNSQVLARPSGFLKGFDFSLNPYRGCAFGCSYCYAAAFVADEGQRADWGKWVEVKTSALEQIARRKDLKGAKVFMSSATDPYQPIESRLKLTRSIVELLAEEHRQPRLRVQTRSPIAVRDIDLFLRFKDLRINFSITTDDDEVRRRFEPACPSIEQRIEAARQCIDAGLKVGVWVSPMLPIRDIEAFVLRLKAMKPYQIVTTPFHSSDKPFAANTRTEAAKTMQEYGWNPKERLVAAEKFDRVALYSA